MTAGLHGRSNSTRHGRRSRSPPGCAGALEFGSEPWQTARLGVSFLNERGEEAGPPVTSVRALEGAWRTVSNVATIPPGATRAVVNVAHLGEAGEMGVDDIQISTDK